MTEGAGRGQGNVGGVMWMGGGRIVARGFVLISRVVLARLLAPEDFGLVALALVVVAFQDLLAGMGLPVALVQAKEIDQRGYSSAFWFCSFQAGVLGVVAAVASPFLASLLGDARLAPFVVALSLSGISLAPVAVLESRLLRSSDFRAIALSRVIAQVLGSVVAVVTAVVGWDVWSLVAGRVTTMLLTLVLVARAAAWWPSLTFRADTIRRLMGLGAGFTVAGVVHAVNRQLPAVLVGRFLGPEALGFFTLAQQILLLPVQYVARPIAKVLFPAFARLQDEPDELAASFQRWQLAVVGVASVLPALAIPLAPLAIPFALGDRWSGGVVVFQLAAIPATARLVVAIVGSLLRGLGRATQVATWTLVAVVAESGGLALGLPWGLETSVAIWSAGQLLTTVAGLLLAARALDRSLLYVARPSLISLPPLATLFAMAQGMLLATAGWPSLVRLIVASLAGVGGYFLIYALIVPKDVRSLKRAVLDRLRSRRSRA